MIPNFNAQSLFWMPEQASTLAQNTDELYYFILYLCTAFFIAIIGAMAYFVIKYRRKSDTQTTSNNSGNHTLEIVWSVIPAALMIVIFVWGFLDWTKLSVPPANALQVRVTGQKWIWNFSYTREGIDSKTLTVPLGRAVQLTMSSKDVLHSFYVPAFRIKRDVLPNRYSVLWFEPTNLGEYDVFCTEYCGDEHSGMINKVRVVTPEDYTKWIDEGGDLGGKGLSAADLGKQLYEAKGCVACHSMDGSVKVGPSFLKKYGSENIMADGSKIKVDDNYIRESILVPGAKLVKGYPPVMPSYQGQLNDKQIAGLIEYLKVLAQ